MQAAERQVPLLRDISESFPESVVEATRSTAVRVWFEERGERDRIDPAHHGQSFLQICEQV